MPDSLGHLVFRGRFHRKIGEGVLPNSLKYLEFGYYRNIRNVVLPDSLIYLKVGKNVIRDNSVPTIIRDKKRKRDD